MNDKYEIAIDEVEEIVAFIKMHEREEIPEDLWDLALKLQDWLEEVI